MPLQAKAGTEFKDAPPGMHVARCVGVIDYGTQTVTWQNDTKHQRKVRVVFELPECAMDDGRPFTISRKYTLSLSRKSSLRRDLVSWRGREFTKEEEAGFLLKNILGAPAMINVVSDGDYTNIATIAPLPKKTKCPKQVNPSTYFSLEPDEFDPKVFAGLSELVRDKIAESPEYRALTGSQDDADDNSGREHDADAPPTDVDEDIPF